MSAPLPEVILLEGVVGRYENSLPSLEVVGGVKLEHVIEMSTGELGLPPSFGIGSARFLNRDGGGAMSCLLGELSSFLVPQLPLNSVFW